MAKVALVTGANKGIGFEVARQLGHLGYTVLLGSRDAARGENATTLLRNEGIDTHRVEVDLLRGEECGKAIAADVESRYGHLDVLVNNAGVWDRQDGSASSVSLDVLRKTFESNLFGVVAFTQPLLPTLKKARHARVVNVSSGLGSLGINADPSNPFYDFKILAYNTSKAALNMFTVALAYDLRSTAIKVNSANPGFTATDMTGNAEGAQPASKGAEEIVRLARLGADGPTAGFFEQGHALPW